MITELGNFLVGISIHFFVPDYVIGEPKVLNTSSCPMDTLLTAKDSKLAAYYYSTIKNSVRLMSLYAWKHHVRVPSRLRWLACLELKVRFARRIGLGSF